jgi:hypothetical protein
MAEVQPIAPKKGCCSVSSSWKLDPSYAVAYCVSVADVAIGQQAINTHGIHGARGDCVSIRLWYMKASIDAYLL